MGKHKFKISDLMPNTWFYKLKDMSKSNRNPNSFTTKRNYNTQANSTTPKPIPSQPHLPNRSSFYLSTHQMKLNPKAIDIHFPTDPPKKTNPTYFKKSIVPSFSPVHKTPPYERDVYTEEDIIKAFDILDGLEINLRPIKTKGLERDEFEDQPSSPRLRSRWLQVYNTRNPLLAGFAVVKSSLDPLRDFRESMMEMIKENGINKVKDLEELLTCYLALNSTEYHSMIVKVFGQICVELHCE